MRMSTRFTPSMLSSLMRVSSTNEVGGGTVGRGERHVDGEVSFIAEVDVVDKSEIVYVDGYLGVIYGFEHRYDALLYI